MNFKNRQLNCEISMSAKIYIIYVLDMYSVCDLAEKNRLTTSQTGINYDTKKVDSIPLFEKCLSKVVNVPTFFSR